MNKKWKAFNHPWHLAHQYELKKLPFIEWEYLYQFKRPYSEKSRGDFINEWVTHYEEGKYDFALLHIDQQCVEDAIWERGKGSLYRELNELITDIPKVVIMHGTNYYPEKFSREHINERIREMVGDNIMVTNSKQAAKDLGFGTPIWHGIDPNEWLDLPKEPRVVTMISPAGLDKYYDRVFLEAVKEELLERGINHCHITVDWQAKDWDDYKNFLGRSLLYFNPTMDSPMPRSRTEAMLSGCCVLTTPTQDADLFIQDGHNGFLVKRNPEWVANKIEYLMNNYEKAIEIGQRGKETAKKTFSVERYQQDWYALLDKHVPTKHAKS